MDGGLLLIALLVVFVITRPAGQKGDEEEEDSEWRDYFRKLEKDVPEHLQIAALVTATTWHRSESERQAA